MALEYCFLSHDVPRNRFWGFGFVPRVRSSGTFYQFAGPVEPGDPHLILLSRYKPDPGGGSWKLHLIATSLREEAERHPEGIRLVGSFEEMEVLWPNFLRDLSRRIVLTILSDQFVGEQSDIGDALI